MSLKLFKKGFTLIEILISISILGFLIIIISGFWTTNLRLQNNASAKLEMVDDARKLLKPFLNEVRAMVPSEQGAYHIESASSNSLIFFSDVDGDGVVERVRYFINNNQLKRGVVEPSGSPLVYVLGNENVKTLINNVSGLDFTYYNENYTGQGQEGILSGNFSVSDIRMIKVSLTIDDDINRDPSPVGVVESAVTVRNLKDNL